MPFFFSLLIIPSKIIFKVYYIYICICIHTILCELNLFFLFKRENDSIKAGRTRTFSTHGGQDEKLKKIFVLHSLLRNLPNADSQNYYSALFFLKIASAGWPALQLFKIPWLFPDLSRKFSLTLEFACNS